jgi:hypothetical protein
MDAELAQLLLMRAAMREDWAGAAQALKDGADIN